MELKIVSDSELDTSANPITNKNELEVSVGPFRIAITTFSGPLGRLYVNGTLKYDANQPEIPIALHIALEKGINVPEYQEGAVASRFLDMSRSGSLILLSLMIVNVQHGNALSHVAVEWVDTNGQRHSQKLDITVEW